MKVKSSLPALRSESASQAWRRGRGGSGEGAMLKGMRHCKREVHPTSWLLGSWASLCGLRAAGCWICRGIWGTCRHSSRRSQRFRRRTLGSASTWSRVPNRQTASAPSSHSASWKKFLFLQGFNFLNRELLWLTGLKCPLQTWSCFCLSCKRLESKSEEKSNAKSD